MALARRRALSAPSPVVLTGEGRHSDGAGGGLLCSFPQIAIQPLQINQPRALFCGQRLRGVRKPSTGKEDIVHGPTRARVGERGEHLGRFLLDQFPDHAPPHGVRAPLGLAKQQRLVPPVDGGDVDLHVRSPVRADLFDGKGQLAGPGLGQDPLAGTVPQRPSCR